MFLLVFYIVFLAVCDGFETGVAFPAEVAYYPVTLQAKVDGLNAGNQYGSVVVDWSAVETSPGVYDFSSITAALTSVQDTGFNSVEVIFDVVAPPPVQTQHIPSFYQSLTWSQRIAPFANMSFGALATIQASNVSVYYILIGTDIDYYFGISWDITSPEFVQFRSFYQSTSTFFKSLSPFYAISCSFSYNTLSLVNTSSSMAPIFGFMDFIAVSYYLINPADNFTVRSPNGISVELFKLVYNPVFLGRVFGFTQCGHPSSPVFSSLEAQRFFIEAVYQFALNQVNAIAFIRFGLLNDLSLADADLFAQAFSNFGPVTPGTAAVEFFATLGLRNINSTQKPGWCLLKEYAFARGLGSASRDNSSFCSSFLTKPPTSSYDAGEYAFGAIVLFALVILLFLLIMFMIPTGAIGAFFVPKEKVGERKL